jgi:hypothetical protein
MTQLSPVERDLLRRLAEVGGRYTFRPDGSSIIAQRVFAEGILSVLLSLEDKLLVRLDPRGTEIVAGSLETNRFVAVTAELTDSGREAIR